MISDRSIQKRGAAKGKNEIDLLLWALLISQQTQVIGFIRPNKTLTVPITVRDVGVKIISRKKET